MRVIIAGGAGLIGRAVAASLAGDGYEVVVLSRTPEKVHDLPAGVRAVRWDGSTAAGWGDLADGAEAIINLAGASLLGLWTKGYKRVIRQSRADAGQAIVQAVQAARVKPQVVVQQSGIGHYGIHQDEIITEANGSAGPDFLSSVTVDWENATSPVEVMGVRRVVLRTGLVFARDGGLLPLMLLPFRLFVGGRMGSGRQWLSWMHVDDEVQAIRFLMAQREAHGAFNLCAPNAVTNAEFSASPAGIWGGQRLITAPAFALRLLLGELSMMVLEGQRAIPERLSGMGYHFRYPDIEPALRACVK